MIKHNELRSGEQNLNSLLFALNFLLCVCDPVRRIWSLWSSCCSDICSSETPCRSDCRLNTGSLWSETSWCSSSDRTTWVSWSFFKILVCFSEHQRSSRLLWSCVFQTAFSDMYLGYTTTLASFLSLEFSRLNQAEKSHKTQVL